MWIGGLESFHNLSLSSNMLGEDVEDFSIKPTNDPPESYPSRALHDDPITIFLSAEVVDMTNVLLKENEASESQGALD